LRNFYLPIADGAILRESICLLFWSVQINDQTDKPTCSLTEPTRRKCRTLRAIVNGSQDATAKTFLTFIPVVKAGSVAFAATRLKAAKSGRAAATTIPIFAEEAARGAIRSAVMRS
jgi:hypothetical protein